MRILVVNVGSSSLKLSLLEDGSLLASSDRPRPEPSTLDTVLTRFVDENPDIDAVGHRVVHGGPMFTDPLVLDVQADATLAALSNLAPLHNPAGVAAIRVLRSLRPTLPQVACFDTMFHADMPAKARTYAIPRAWREQWGIRRFGFHGLSHSWASRRAGELIGRPVEELRLVTAHLGAGASLAAVVAGDSVDTTMGFTPLEGLVMGTRSGSVDPGVLLWVQRNGGLSAEQVEEALEHESGLRGLGEGSGDLRDVVKRMDSGDTLAELAYAVYVYRIQTGIAAMCAAMGGTDGLVFTGGAGEGEPRLRRDACSGLEFLGLTLADANNRSGATDDRVVSPKKDGPAVVVVHAREDLEIARHVQALLA